MKKLLMIFMVACMALAIASCDTGSKNNFGNSDLNYEIGDTGGLKVPFGKGETIRFIGVNATQTTSTYIFEKLSEITGLNIELESYPVSSYVDKVKVVLASKNIPEIIGDGLGTIYAINDLAIQGAFAPVNDYLDDMPNFKRIFGENSDYNWVFKAYAASDGKLYGMPGFDYQRDVNHGMLYRKDIFDKYNIPMWNSPDSFYSALKALKKADPSCIPFTSKQGDALIKYLSTSWGVEAYENYYDENEKIWKYSDTDPKMKNMLDYLAKLYKENLIDPEFLTLTQADWTSKMTSNKAYTTFDWIGRLDMFQEQTTVEGYNLRYANPIGPNQSIVTLAKVVPIFAAVSKNDKAKLSMKLMDFLYSDAGAELMTMGIKGETYELDEKGKAKYLEFDPSKKIQIQDLEVKYGMFMQGTYKRMDKRSCYFTYSEREQEAQDLANNNNMYEPLDPVLGFTSDVQSKNNEYQSQLSAAFKEFMFKYIVGTKTGDAAWEEWLKKAKALGEEEYVHIYNEAHKATYGN